MLDLALLTLAALAEPSCRAHPWQMHALVTEADRASRRHSLPVGLLVAVVLAESGGRNIISRRRYNGSRDHGVMQINAHHLSKRRLALLLTLEVNTDRGASILASSRSRCAGRACRCLEAHDNWNSRTWCGRVHAIWRRRRGRLQPVGNGGLST